MATNKKTVYGAEGANGLCEHAQALLQVVTLAVNHG